MQRFVCRGHLWAIPMTADVPEPPDHDRPTATPTSRSSEAVTALLKSLLYKARSCTKLVDEQRRTALPRVPLFRICDSVAKSYRSHFPITTIDVYGTIEVHTMVEICNPPPPRVSPFPIVHVMSRNKQL